MQCVAAGDKGSTILSGWLSRLGNLSYVDRVQQYGFISIIYFLCSFTAPIYSTDSVVQCSASLGNFWLCVLRKEYRIVLHSGKTLLELLFEIRLVKSYMKGMISSFPRNMFAPISVLSIFSSSIHGHTFVLFNRNSGNKKWNHRSRVHHCEETLFSWWWRSLLGSPTFVFLVRLFCFSLFLFVLLCPLSNSFSNKVDQNSPLVMKKTRKVSPKS